jgi:tetratricopeptide (TPR) repeat protein
VVGLLNAGRWHEAIGAASTLLQHAPEQPELLQLLAAALDGAGRQPEAATVYARLVRAAPQNARVWLNYGHVLRMIGRTDEAVNAYRRALHLAPGMGEVYWSLADIKTFRFDPSDLRILRALSEQPLSGKNGAYLLYAFAKALEQEGRYSEAFDRYRQGAALCKSRPDETATLHAFVERCETVFSQAFFESRKGAGAPGVDPIFVVGLPRSGSTLVEQILASHSQVEGTMELSELQALAYALAGPIGAGHVDLVRAASAERLTAVGEAYLKQTQMRRSGSPFFVDKMPLNWRHVALIHLALPRAKIIDVRRHPLACGWSCFTQHFSHEWSFTYDLGEIGRYYAAYVRLGKHYDAVLPGRVHRIIYEDLIADPEAQIGALLDYCGLPREPSCFSPHETERVVRSISAEQVREPINRKGIDRWRPYEPFLSQLKEALGPTLHCYPGAP